MIYFVSALMGFGLVVAQTAFLPRVMGGATPYDLVVPLMIYLGLYRSPREGLPLALVCGWLMDGVGGGPWGIYMAVYLALVAGAHGVASFLRLKNLMLLLVVPLAVGLENILCIAAAIFLQKENFHLALVYPHILRQILWAAFSGMPLLWLLDTIITRVENWRAIQKLTRNYK